MAAEAFYAVVLFWSSVLFTQLSCDSIDDVETVLSQDTHHWRLFRNKNGDLIDRYKLLQQYGLICPIPTSCGPIDYYQIGEDEYRGEKLFKSCKECTCDAYCMAFGKCCPDLAISYLKHSCIDTVLYRHSKSVGIPTWEYHEKTEPLDYEKDGPQLWEDVIGWVYKNSNSWNFMITTCPERTNETERLLCAAGNMAPVSSNDSLLTYRNQYCARCHQDDESLHIWDVKFICDNNFPFKEEKPAGGSNLEMMMHGGQCTVKYDPGHPSEAPPIYYCNYLLPHTYKISRCNVTGLWKDYDADIEWGCENLQLTFKWRYKNVFCYICNPSIVSTKSELIYDRCNMTGRWEHFNVHVENACHTYPRTRRLSPFKNIYCIMCNGYRRIHRKNVGGGGGALEIDEVYFTDTHPAPPISVYLKLGGNNIVDKSKDAFKVITEEFDSYNYEIKMEDTDKAGTGDVADSDTFVKHYFDVCGYQKLCEPEVYLPDVNDTSGRYSRNTLCSSCSCDSKCAAQGECCVDKLIKDKPYSCIKEPRFLTFNASIFDFVPDEGKSMTVIGKCMDRSDTDLVERCEMDYYNRSDIWQYLPAYSSDIYKNIYCAVCNNPNTEVIHKVSIVCQHYFETALLTNLSEVLRLAKQHCLLQIIPNNYNGVCGNVDTKDDSSTIISKCNETGIWEQLDESIVNGCEGVSQSSTIFLPTIANKINEIKYYKNYFCLLCNPETKLSSVTKIYDSCNMTGRWHAADDYLEESCDRKTMVAAWLPFKNVYCYICNGGFRKEVEHDYRPTPSYVDVTHWFMLTDMDPSLGSTYRMLFSLSPEEWQRLYPYGDDPNKLCPAGHTYDYETESCRMIFCADDAVFVDNTCLLVSNIMPKAEGKLYITARALIEPKDDSSSWYNRDMVLNTHGTDYVYISLRYMCDLFTHGIELKIRRKGYNIAFPVCKIYTKGSCSSNWDDISVDKPVVLFLKNEAFFFELNVAYYGHATKNKVRQTLAKIAETTLTLLGGEVFFEFKVAIVNAAYDFETNCMTEVNYDLPVDESILYQSSISTTSSVKDRIQTCLQIELHAEEFTFNSTMNTVAIKNGTKTLVDGEFTLIDNSTVRVCKSDYIGEVTQTLFQVDITAFHKAHNIFSYIFTLTSLICLLLTFAIYCIIPQLRTVPGRNIMSLCASLFLAQGSLQFSSFIFTHEVICVPFAMLTHYSWLATFCGMNVCSFHMYKMFYLKFMTSSDASVSIKYTKRYLSYTYGFPLIIVALTIGIHLAISNGTFTGYGKFACFLSDIYTITFAFIVPAAMIFVTNFAFFAVAFHTIKSSPRIGSSRKDRREFFMYLKLCTLTGVSWPLQIIDGFLPLTVFSFFVVFINALQGFYIFVSYACNGRVYKLVMEKFQTKKDLSFARGSIRGFRQSTRSTLVNTVSKTDSLQQVKY